MTKEEFEGVAKITELLIKQNKFLCEHISTLEQKIKRKDKEIMMLNDDITDNKGEQEAMKSYYEGELEDR